MEHSMPTLAADHVTFSPLAQNLRNTNSRLCFWLDSLAIDRPTPHDLAAGRAENSPFKRPPAHEQMAGLLSELTRAGAWLRQLPRGNDSVNDPKSDVKADPELEDELANYRKNVERVRAILPAIQRALLEERARLERERARVCSAAEWARGSRQTL
jgi:hypothetical protein